MKIQFLLSEKAKKAYFVETSSIAPTVIHGEVSPSNWDKEKRAKAAEWISSNGIDLTSGKCRIISGKPNLHGGRLVYVDFRSDSFDPEEAFEQFLADVEQNDERQKLQEKAAMKEGRDIDWKPLLAEAQAYKDEMEKQKQERIKKQNEEYNRKRAKMLRAAEEKQKEIDQEVNELKEWVKANGSELVRKRMEGEYDWKAEAVREMLSLKTGLVLFFSDEDIDSCENPTLAAMKSKDKITKMDLPDGVSVHVVSDCDGEYLNLHVSRYGIAVDLYGSF